MATIDQVGRIFAGIERQISSRTAKALTATARRIRDEVRIEMATVFDRPTSFTMNGVFWKGASDNERDYIGGVNKDNPKGRLMRNQMFAQVWFKDQSYAGKGIAAGDYLKPQVFGGNRVQKRMEKALQRAGILPVGMFAVPGKGAKLDAYGNMSRGQIVQIISWFQAFGLQGYSANMTGKRKAALANMPDKRKAALGKDKTSRKTGLVTKGFSYFVLSHAKAGRLPGIYQKIDYGGKPVARCVMLFIRTPAYQKRFDFFGIAERTVQRHFATFFAAATESASRRAA